MTNLRFRWQPVHLHDPYRLYSESNHIPRFQGAYGIQPKQLSIPQQIQALPSPLRRSATTVKCNWIDEAEVVFLE